MTDMKVDMVADMEMNKVADMEVGRVANMEVHPLTKSHICHLGVIFFLCGPNEKTKIVSKALIDCATQQRVSKL